MIRTRDLVLFVLVILFISVAIAVTLLQGPKTEPTRPVSFSVSPEGYAATIGSAAPTIDRKKNIALLREKLLQSKQRIDPVASVEDTRDVESTTTNTQKSAPGVQKCLYPDDALSLVPRWPLEGVHMSVQGMERIVTRTQVSYRSVEQAIRTTSSTTPSESTTITQTLITMPRIAVKNTDTSCVPSEVIGVTTSGSLIFNGDINSYRKISSDTLIGYARDGFPIYGVYEGVVDACGGYDSPSGYRYTVSASRNYILGCYVGTPQKFSL